MQRIGQVIKLDPEGILEYKELHTSVWPKVLEMISSCNITNYSIFLKEPENLLFAYLEYVGDDFNADMTKMAADAETQRWWEICIPLQRPLETRADGEWWANMEEVFHYD